MFNQVTDEEFEVLSQYLATPEIFSTFHDPNFWKPFKHGLYISKPDAITHNRYYHLPVSHYIHPENVSDTFESLLFDFEEDDEPTETVIKVEFPQENDRFEHGATFINDKVYVEIDEPYSNSSLKTHLDSSNNPFLLKELAYSIHKVKPLNLVNPNVYIGDLYFRQFKMYWMMRFVGDNLYDFFSLNPNLPSNIIDEIINQLIHLVHSFHEQSIIHTDIKPENICIQFNHNGNPAIHLIDFDDSIMRHFNHHLPKILPGTFTYYAPEIFINIPKQIQELNAFLAFQELAFNIINKTATPEHEANINVPVSEQSSLCIFPDINDEPEIMGQLHQLSPKAFFAKFINENYIDYFGTQTDLFALGCTLNFILNYHPEPETSAHYKTMEKLLSYDPQSRRLSI